MNALLLRLSSFVLALALVAFAAVEARAATYYVAPSPTGDDENPGTEEQPFASMMRAQEAASGGDTVYFKGGTYAFDRGTTTCSSGTANISGVLLNKSGSAGATINYFAVPGENPVFDYDAVLDSCRIRGITLSANYIHIKGLEIQNVRQNNNLNHENWGIWISGSNNIVEQVDVHNIMGAGIFINGGSNNLILNCDSHDNLDEFTSNGAGESADGFGCHGSGSGNVFRGCRAWWNADDGYDFINSDGVCTVEDSWAWYNGYVPGTLDGIGNGNGFKAGGYGLDPATFPNDIPVHVTQRCLSVANRAAGFYANHHPGKVLFYNNTSYGNHPNYNMLGITTSGADVTVGEYRNNIALAATDFSNRNNADEADNSWTIGGITVSDADFQNVSVEGLDAPRKADGSLPDIPNFRLATDSDLIDQGVDVGLPFAGTAPDLGCFETGLEPAGEGGAGGMNGEGGDNGGNAGNGGGSQVGDGGESALGGQPGAAGANPTDPSGAGAGQGGNPGTAMGGAGTRPPAVGGAGNPGSVPVPPAGNAGTGGATPPATGPTPPGPAPGTVPTPAGPSASGSSSAAPSSSSGVDSDSSADPEGCSCSLPGTSQTPRAPVVVGLLLLGLAGVSRARRRTSR